MCSFIVLMNWVRRSSQVHIIADVGGRPISAIAYIVAERSLLQRSEVTMGRIALSKTLHMTDGPDQCIDAIRRYLLDHGLELRHGIDQEIEGYPGSRYETRLIGGWLLEGSRLPVWVRIYCDAGPRGSTNARVVIEEALAAAALEGEQKRSYKSSFRKLLNALAGAAPAL